MNNLLAIDIGNTTIEFALFDGDVIVKKFFCDSKPLDFELIKNKLPELLIGLGNNIVALVSSVVPSNNQLIKEFLFSQFQIKTFIIDAKKHKMLVQVKERNIHEVGMDILCKGAFAVHNYKKNVLILDVGTATVLQYINDGYLDKVAITIGLGTIYKSLNKSTALLPLLIPKASKDLLGGNTIEAIYGGTYWGYIGIIEKWIEKAMIEAKGSEVFLTGGLSSLIQNDVNHPLRLDKDIIFKGIQVIYNLNKESMI